MPGSPKQFSEGVQKVIDAWTALAPDASFGGMTLAFVDYVSELEYFSQEVLPRLEAMGVRKPR